MRCALDALLLVTCAAAHDLTRAAFVRGAVAASGLAAGGLLRAGAEVPSSDAVLLPVPPALDPETWPLDETQWSSYDPSRAVLFDTQRGSFLPADPKAYLASALRRGRAEGAAPPRVIFAGEEHTNPTHHRYQLELIEAVNELDDAPLAIGLEMFYRQHQPALDEFVFVDGDFGKLKKRTHWSSTWGYNFNDYAKVLAYARRHRIRLVGLNVPYPLVAMVAQYGLDRVPVELRPFLPEMDLGNAEHLERFEQSMASLEQARLAASPGAPDVPPPHASPHGASGGSAFRRSYEAMTLWDEYMAASVARYLDPNLEPAAQRAAAGATLGRDAKVRAATWRDDGRMVVLVGASHVRGRVGVPDRFTRRSGLPTFSMVPMSVPWAAAGIPAIERPLPASEADWVLYTQPEIRAAGGPATATRPVSARMGERGRVSFSALRVGTQVAPIIEL